MMNRRFVPGAVRHRLGCRTTRGSQCMMWIRAICGNLRCDIVAVIRFGIEQRRHPAIWMPSRIGYSPTRGFVDVVGATIFVQRLNLLG